MLFNHCDLNQPTLVVGLFADTCNEVHFIPYLSVSDHYHLLTRDGQ